MKGLAKLGFTQSYTYFTWRTQKWELEQYLNELTAYPERDFYRPNFFVNTPDILPYHLQGGEAWMFKSRVALAATLSGTYGIYNGFELLEHDPIPGTGRISAIPKNTRSRCGTGTSPATSSPISATSTAPAATIRRCSRPSNLRFIPIEDGNVIGFVKESVDRTNSVVVADRAVARAARILVSARRRPGRHARRPPPRRRG